MTAPQDMQSGDSGTPVTLAIGSIEVDCMSVDTHTPVSLRFTGAMPSDALSPGERSRLLERVHELAA